MPRWGQLGCNGFIILGPNQEVVTRATSAFMQVRQLAFRHVETILTSLFNNQSIPTVCPGEFVKLSGLQAKPELNGQTGICIGEAAQGRLPIQLLQERRSIRVRPQNLVVVKNNEEEEEVESQSQND
jgi:hypothetical protein